ncbi:hypothetical protein SAMN05518672_103689 [Chitinophaga sp. CF118]|nr:hypothetical protein SAMN05518672_103689 [Chitinophaga sp. CF118]
MRVTVRTSLEKGKASVCPVLQVSMKYNVKDYMQID